MKSARTRLAFETIVSFVHLLRCLGLNRNALLCKCIIKSGAKRNYRGKNKAVGKPFPTKLPFQANQ
jgi:hypothetical protein